MGEILTSHGKSAAYRFGAAREFIEGRLRLGTVAFSLSDFREESKLSRLASRRQLERLGRWVAKLPRKDFYLIVAPEHRGMGAPPPEASAVGAVSSAVAVHVASRRWLSFFR